MVIATCVLTAVDRRGESEESGDDETKRKSINGEVDPQRPSTGDDLSKHKPSKLYFLT